MAGFLPVARVLQWRVSGGMPLALVAAAARCQLLRKLRLRAGDADWDLANDRGGVSQGPWWPALWGDYRLK